jgi:amino acid adenylation domain-containing protein
MQEILVSSGMTFNGSTAAHGSSATFLELFEQQCRRTPEKPAVAFERSHLTYRDLECRSNQLANYLQARGRGPGSVVGICIRRSLDMMVGLLGILKSGAAYLPLDPEYPEERIRFVLQDSTAKFIISESEFLNLLRSGTSDVLCLDTQWGEVAEEPVSYRSAVVGPENMAYLIYTSGSSGQPKGVMIPHRALRNLLTSTAFEPGLDSTDVLLAITTLSFDIAGLELFLPLIMGARVVIAGTGVARNPLKLQRLMDESGATVMQGTPSTWQMLVDSGWPGRRTLKALAGGETLSRELADRLLDRVGSLWNMYGPTETTIWSMTERVTNEPGPVTIGHPIRGTRIYIVDEDGDLVSGDGRGELCIGGAGLALGYWNRPELTANRFVLNRFDDYSSRLYRTGDEVSRRTDGRIHFLGRNDNQVKIRGHRVELQEIEAVLRQHARVRDCVVRGNGSANTNQQLVAYVVPADGDVPPEPVEMRQYLNRRLPDHMVPSIFVTVPKLPLTPNGKVDRRSLLISREETQSTTGAKVTYDNDAEKQIARVFERILAVESVGPTASFFDLGGHSLLAVRLVSELEKVFGRSIPLGQIFRAPTVAGLATVLMEQEAHSSSVVAIQPLGTLQPFFCVHSQASNVLNFRALAALLGADQPFYAFEPRGLDGKSEPHYRIEDMAAQYIIDMRRIQSEGPYALGGVCLGGIVALEMAQQLRQAGEEVTLVALIDTHFPALPTNFQKVQKHSILLWRSDRFLGELLSRPPLEACKHGVARIAEFFQRRVKARNDPATLAKVMYANMCAEASYVPKSYPGALKLFWCSGWAFRAYQDTRLAWGEIAAGGLEVHVVPGNHISMMEPPNVEVMAAKLSKCLEKSRQSVQSPQIEAHPK